MLQSENLGRVTNNPMKLGGNEATKIRVQYEGVLSNISDIRLRPSKVQVRGN
jgi:hypothetical protein